MKRLEGFPYFLFLLPAFYFLYELTEYGNYLFSYSTVFKSFAVITIVTTLIFIIVYNIKKQVSISFSIGFFILMFVYLFFGIIKTGLMSLIPILGSYKILIPLMIGIMLFLSRFLNKQKHSASAVFQYCNLLMIVLVMLQTVLLCLSFKNKADDHLHTINFSRNPPHSPPNIYLILMDGYAGNASLKDYFHYDNSALTNDLRTKGFYVADSFHSNYNITAGSMNSFLNMQYLDLNAFAPFNQYSFYLKSIKATQKGILLNAFQHWGYKINNYSIFDFEHIGKGQEVSAWQKAEELIEAPMFHNKIKHDLGWLLYTGKYKSDNIYRKEVLKQFYLNQDLIEKTMLISQQKSSSPQFTYTHLLLPHEPYFADSTGHLYQEEESLKLNNEEKYLSYLKYANTKIIALADTIRRHDSQALIIFLSDHGYSHYPPEAKELVFNNFFALSQPRLDTLAIRNVQSNLNIFPALMNQFFGQHLLFESNQYFYIDEEKNTATLHQSKQ